MAAAEHRACLLTLAERLVAALPEETAGAAREIVRGLRARAVRIVVTGLPGPHKARVFNALAGRPGLLPERPPAKSAIATRLHFARPGGPEKGAMFHFFDAAEWAEIATGGGRLRPGLATGALDALRCRLAREVEEMRTRAYMRLGDAFHQHLGQGRRIEDLTESALAHVYGAEPRDGGRAGGRGRYADMTREAQIFLGAGPFALPVSVTDSPGMDPDFALREERTAMLLDEADLCVHVVAADAPLGSADREALGLVLRRMAGRVAVFLERRDDTAGEAAAGGGAPAPARVDPVALREAVAAICGQAASGQEVPVLLGRTGAGDVADLLRVLDALMFWGPALALHGAAAATLADLARSGQAAHARDIRIIRGRYGADGGIDTEAERIRVEASGHELERAFARARDGLDADLSGLWTAARSEAIAALRQEAKAQADAWCGPPVTGTEAGGDAAAGTGQAQAGAEPAGAPAAPPVVGLAVPMRERLGTLLLRWRAQTIEATETARAALAAVLEEAGVPPCIGGASDGLAALELSETLDPLALAEDRSVDLTASLARRMGAAAVQRALAGPFLAQVEATVEAATLALGRAARETLDRLHRQAAEELLANARAASRANRLAELEGAEAACVALAERLEAFRKAGEGQEAGGPGPDARTD